MGLESYVNRTVDVVAYQGGSVGSVSLRQNLVEPTHGGTLCTGIQKLVQKFLILLLTEKGSIVHFPQQGTTFITEARQGRFRTTSDVFAAFSAAVEDIREQLLSVQQTTDPEDEQFLHAEAINVVLRNAVAELVVRLHAVSGDQTEFIAPIQVTVA